MIELTKIQIGPYERPVPPGLNELLQDCWVPKEKKTPRPKFLDDYESRVEMRDGKIFTIITKK